MPWLTCARALPVDLPQPVTVLLEPRAAGSATCSRAHPVAEGKTPGFLKALFLERYNDFRNQLKRRLGSEDGARRDAGGVPQSQRAAAGHAGAAAGGLSVPDGAERRRGSQASGFTAADGRGDRRTDQCGGRSLGPARIAQGRNEIEVFRRALRGLPERTQQMLLAARVHELPHAEIARRYGVSERIVSRKSSARWTTAARCARAMNRAGSHGRDDAAREESGRRAEGRGAGLAAVADVRARHRGRRGGLPALAAGGSRNEAAFAEQQGLWRALGPALMEESAARARAPERRPAMGRRAFLGSAVAASAAYLALRPPLGLWPGIGELAADYRTARGEQRRLTLGDALDVQMNTLTRINVTVGADGAKLIELADGEAEVRAGAEPSGGRGRRPDPGPRRQFQPALRRRRGAAVLPVGNGAPDACAGRVRPGRAAELRYDGRAYSRRRRWIRIASLPGGRAGWCSTSSPCPRWWMS